MHDLQRQVQDAIDQLVPSGAERGLQVAVYRHGDQVVDAVAGVADPATGRPVTPDTPIVELWSPLRDRHEGGRRRLAVPISVHRQ
jgi:CubicO group peptidase (beta-lactamase class C family)